MIKQYKLDFDRMNLSTKDVLDAHKEEQGGYKSLYDSDSRQEGESIFRMLDRVLGPDYK